MTYSDEEIRRRLRLGEDSRWEFKQIDFSGDLPVAPHRDSLADELAAFANGHGGVMLCGVSCEGCGEEIINEREIVRAGRTLCRSCAGAGYYSVIRER